MLRLYSYVRSSMSILVEAAGIEPASEGIRQRVTTCLSSSVLLVPRGPKRQRPEGPAPKVFRSPASGPDRFAILLGRRSRCPAGEGPGNGVPFYQAATAKGSAVNCFHRFCEDGWDLGMPLVSHYLRRDQFAPTPLSRRGAGFIIGGARRSVNLPKSRGTVLVWGQSLFGSSATLRSLPAPKSSNMRHRRKSGWDHGGPGRPRPSEPGLSRPTRAPPG